MRYRVLFAIFPGAKLDALYQQAEPILDRDPYPPRRVTVATDNGYPSIIASMKDFIVRRYETARAQLDDPATERPVHPSEQGPRPGEPVYDDPSELEVMRVEEEGIHLRWRDNSDREELTIVQRCHGVACTTFENRAGIAPDQPPEFVDDRAGIAVLLQTSAWP